MVSLRHVGRSDFLPVSLFPALYALEVVKCDFSLKQTINRQYEAIQSE